MSKKLIQRLKNAKLSHKIALSGLALILVSTLLSAVFLTAYFSAHIVDISHADAVDRSEQMSDYFNERLKSIVSKVYAMKGGSEFSDSSYLCRFVRDDEQDLYPLALTALSDQLSQLRGSDSFISSVFIYTPKGDFYDIARIRQIGSDFTSTLIYRQIEQAGSFTIYWGEPEVDEIYSDNEEIIPVVIPFQIEGYGKTCYIVVNLDEQSMLDYLKIQPANGSNLLIVTNGGKQVAAYWSNMSPVSIPMLTSVIGTRSAGSQMIRSHADQYLATYNSIGIAPWKLIILQSQNYLSRYLTTARNFVLLFTLLDVILCFVISIGISNSITQPLTRLRNTILQVTNRHFDIRFVYEYHDEVGELGKSFNFMLDEIRNLIGQLNVTIRELSEEKEKVKSEQIMKRKAELKALQAQINPHFLYNTLDSIVWMAEDVQAPGISRIAAALGRFFRITLSGGREVITLQEERDHVESYLQIQKIRYAEKLEYAICFDKAILPHPTIKLIIQPLVENAIYHGIKCKDGPGHIRIAGRIVDAGRTIELTVSDDGVGIPPEKLESLNCAMRGGEHTQSDSHGYGIGNVNERIRLFYGDTYGVWLESVWGAGTNALIRIPV